MNATLKKNVREREIALPKLRAMDFTATIWEHTEDYWFAAEIDPSPWQLCYAKMIRRGYAK